MTRVWCASCAMQLLYDISKGGKEGSILVKVREVYGKSSRQTLGQSSKQCQLLGFIEVGAWLVCARFLKNQA